MSLPQSSQTPIVEFLGEDAGAGGPFSILGLRHNITSNEQVIRACNRRLSQINRHQHRSTPDASEVRLAVHAATSQLLDPLLRAELVQRWPEGTPISVPKAWKPIQKTASLPAGFISNARLLIAASGGWNATARKRLAHFARMNRVTALELVLALGTKSSSGPTLAHSHPLQELTQIQNERIELIGLPPSRSLQWAFVYFVMLAMAVSVMTAVVISPPNILIPDTTTGVNQIADDVLRVKAETFLEEVGQDLSGPDRTHFAHYTAVAHELDQLVTRSVSDPEQTVGQFTIVYNQFVDSWTAFPMPALERSVLHIAEIVSRASNSLESSEAVFDLLSVFSCDISENDPAKNMIRLAVIDVILSDPSVTDEVRKKLVLAVKKCTGVRPHATASFNESLAIFAGLEGVGNSTDDPDWWGRWLQGVSVFTVENEPQKTRLVLSAMSARLRDQSPSNVQWKQTVIELVNAVSWQDRSPARYWLFGQFADEAANTTRLSALTEAIAMHSKASQIDAKMVLNPIATFSQRQQMAQAYRNAWSVNAAAGEEASITREDSRELISELRVRVSITPVQIEEQQAIVAMIELVRLNTAAWQYGRGDYDLAARTLEGAGDSLSSATSPEILKLDMNPRDIRWAQDAMNAQNASELSSLFSELVQDNGPGANGAHALVYLATLHADSEIRSLASAQLVRYRDQTAVLVALDHVISNKRISTRLERLVLKVVDRSLPSRADERWYIIVHKALLSLVAQSVARTIDTNLTVFQSELGAVYWARLTTVQASMESPAVMRQLYQELRDDVLATPQYFPGLKSPQAISSMLAVRIARANSPIHHFLAYQMAICELHALRIDRDTLGVSTRLEVLFDELRMNLNNSTSVIGQIAQVERCISQIWILNLEGTQP